MSRRMPVSDVYVVQGVSGDWAVSNRKRTLARYQSQHGAVAFARATPVHRSRTLATSDPRVAGPAVENEAQGHL